MIIHYSSPRKWISHSQFASSQQAENTEEKGLNNIISRLSRLLSGKESTCQCRKCKRLRFDPWVRQIPWRKKWQPTPVSLPGKFHGQRSLVGYSPWGCKELEMTKHAHKYICLGIWPWGMWYLAWPGMETVPLALEGKVLIPEAPGKSLNFF